jgi:hypothetical protein
LGACCPVKSQRAGERVLHSVARFLQHKLKLVVNDKKSRVAPTDQSAFLGFTFRGTSIRWTDKSLAEFKRQVRLLTGRSWGVSMDYRLKKVAEYVRGWMGYYALSEFYRPIPELDHWLRRRVRCCYWKQWRWCRTKVRELRKLGTSLHAAIQVRMSRKSYWRLSRTLATQTGMTNVKQCIRHAVGGQDSSTGVVGMADTLPLDRAASRRAAKGKVFGSWGRGARQRRSRGSGFDPRRHGPPAEQSAQGVGARAARSLRAVRAVPSLGVTSPHSLISLPSVHVAAPPRQPQSRMQGCDPNHSFMKRAYKPV